jgi:hypothetical protein
MKKYDKEWLKPSAIDTAFWTITLLKKIDSAVVKLFPVSWQKIGMQEDANFTALASYTHSVQDIIKKHHPRQQGLDTFLAHFK